MKIPSHRALRRTLAAVTLTTAIALTGCSGDQAAPTGGSDQGGQAPAASDGGGAPAAGGQGGEQPQMPEADVSDVPDVVAEVNGEKVTKDEFVAVYEGQFQQAAMQQQSTGQEVDQATLKQQVADQLVNNRLLLQGATDAGIEPTDADIDATLDEIAKQSGLGSGDEVVSALEQQGMSAEDIRKDAASQFKLTTFIEQEAEVKEPSEEELKKQYDAVVEQQKQAGGDTSQLPPFEDAKAQLAQQAVTQQQNEAATSIAAELREAGDVKINL